jgi:hypothetical protein
MNDVLAEAYERLEALRAAIRSTHRGKRCGDFSPKAAAERARLWPLYDEALDDVHRARREAREQELA